MDVSIILKNNINYYMKINNKLISNLSKDLKIPYSTVSDWVHGNSFPRPEKIEILANYFNVAYNDLVSDSSQESNTNYSNINISSEIRATFSKNLKYYMKKKGINGTRLANDLNIKQPTVRDWISGDNYPRVDKINMLANYFGVSYNDLMCENENYEIVEETPNVLDTTYNRPLTLRALRINQGLSLEKVSKLLNVSKETLGNWERGYTYPNVQQIIKLEKIYNIQILTNNVNFFPKN